MTDPGWATRLLAELAHDIRTPITSMVITLSMLEDKHAARFDAEDHADLTTIRSDIQSILDLHEEFARRAGPSGRQVEPIESEFCLDELLSGCLKIVYPLAANKGLTLTLETDGLPILRSDRSMIARVVMNLLANAVRCTDRGSIVLRGQMQEQGISVEVQDSGIGIAPHDLDRIFDEHFQVVPLGGGSQGLGLTMAHQIAKLLGGSLTVVSQLGQGSTFTLSLPARVLAPRASASLNRPHEPTGLNWPEGEQR